MLLSACGKQNTPQTTGSNNLTTVTEPVESDEALEFYTREECENYLAAIDRTNETIVMSDEEFADFINQTYSTARGLNLMFGVGATFKLDFEKEPYIDENGVKYYPFLTDKCHSLSDLWEFMGQFYTDNIISDAKTSSQHIIEKDNFMYDREGEKGNTTSSNTEKSEIVYQTADKITYSIPVFYGDENEVIKICSISKENGIWKYNQWVFY